MLNIQEKLEEFSSKLSSLTQEQLNKWANQTLEEAKIAPIKMNRPGRMLPPGEYDRPIDKYLDETWGKDFFR